MTLAVDQAVNQAGASLRNASSKTQGTGNGKQLGKEDFLNLMMVQMANQDPLDPMDSDQMMQQMAALGTVEQLQGVNAQLGKVVSTQEGIARASAFSYLDKDVEIGTNTLDVREGNVPPASYSLEGPADKVYAHIINEEGEPIRVIKLESQQAGMHSFTWDGTDNDGDQVSNGIYQYRVVATTEDGESINVSQFKKGRVSSVSFENGQAMGVVNGEQIPLTKVKGVNEISGKRFDDALPLPIKKSIQPKQPILQPLKAGVKAP
ncbi:MAG: flagellar hook assembly protein FlgD [SAR324 cluster bacterium]|nr:flagellar hook assembly protein FlgD [SAR324 cluster bacterium]